MRAAMATDDTPSPLRALAAHLSAIGDDVHALAEMVINVSENEISTGSNPNSHCTPDPHLLSLSSSPS